MSLLTKYGMTCGNELGHEEWMTCGSELAHENGMTCGNELAHEERDDLWE